MRFSLSNALLSVALIATGLGWYVDHQRLALSNARLNAEATLLFDKYWLSAQSGGMVSTTFPGGKSVYLHSNAADRAELLRIAEQPFLHSQQRIKSE